MVMAHERPGTKTDCSDNFKPVLSSERVPQFRITNSSVQEKKRESLIIGRKGESDRIDWPSVIGP
jgi:hypothetical protein